MIGKIGQDREGESDKDDVGAEERDRRMLDAV